MMNMLRLIITLVVIIIICLLSFFQMELRGYEKIARLNEWTLYIKEEDDCVNTVEVFYSDVENDYAFNCIMSDWYIVKSGFEEQSLIYALENNLINIDDLDGVIDFFVAIP